MEKDKEYYMEKDKEYYIGLDIGTDSVGYAAIDERYKLVKFKGEPIWGSHLFDAASQSAERRSFRTARRRLDRRQQRVKMVDEIMAPEIIKESPNFFIHKRESALYGDDRSTNDGDHLYFNGGFTDRDYYKKYPTIHHLIVDLMNDGGTKKDIRLINIAVCWLVAHRGHFLSDISVDNVDKILDFKTIYNELLSFFEESGEDYPWDKVDVDRFGGILKNVKGINKKKLELNKLLYDGKAPKNDDYFMDRKELVSFIAGGRVDSGKLFPDYDFEENFKFSISDDMDEVLPKLGDYADLIARFASMYNWSLLSDMLGAEKYISNVKVEQYKQHKTDLKNLKAFVHKYVPAKYDEIFRTVSKDLKNYSAYVYNVKGAKPGDTIPEKKASKDEFYEYIKKNIKIDTDKLSDNDKVFFDDMMSRIEDGSFMPKQVNTDNRVIPHQLYEIELKKILDTASKYHAFLNECDEDGYSNYEKIMSIFDFRIPYYVGPLRTDNSQFGWMVRKAEGKIYPWNFHEKVDEDESEKAFINRMTNTCTYVPGADVVPKCSLLYLRFTVLNEINNLKVNGKAISVEAKQGIYTDLFLTRRKVTVKTIREYLVSHAFMRSDDMLTGIDINVNSSLKTQLDFRRLLDSKVLTEEQVEDIVSMCTYTEDKKRFRKYIVSNYPELSDEDVNYISRLKYKDFGRLSKDFLTGIKGADNQTGEIGTIMHFLWETNDNLMQILSEKYTFTETINQMRREYYQVNKLTLNEQMEELGISNAVKRPVTRTLAVVDDIVSTLRVQPKKIFVEMARGKDEKKQRTVTRKEQILELYKKCDEDTSELEKQLDAMGEGANNRLQSEALFLYYMQLGKCMYSGDPIDISLIGTDKYNIDHIYPQSYVKDDSIINNKVLVLSKINGDKKDKYPIDDAIRHKMTSFWKHLRDKNLISKEKYARLIRSTPYTDEEKQGFINRQLVETRQSMKAVTQLLSNIYPETEIVYVKAKLAADFKQEFELSPKARSANDLHHAKDAYLNAVVGNVYNERFTKKYFSLSEKYSLNTKTLFTRDIIRGEKNIWLKDLDLKTVRRTYEKNNIKLTRYSFCQKGGLFDQMPVKKGTNLTPLKQGMDTQKYGGYNKASSTFFVIAKYMKGNKPEVSFVPVDLMYRDSFIKNKETASEYIANALQKMNSKTISDVILPLGNRVVKYKTVLSLDGFKVWVNGKMSNGKQVVISSAESAKYSKDELNYIKRIERYIEKKNQNKKLIHDEENDHLSEERNVWMYDLLVDKLNSNHFIKLPGNPIDILLSGRDAFCELLFDEQIRTLGNCINILKSGRNGGCDLRDVGGKAKSGVVCISANLSSAKYDDIRILDISPAGLHVNESVNLKDLL